MMVPDSGSRDPAACYQCNRSDSCSDTARGREGTFLSGEGLMDAIPRRGSHRSGQTFSVSVEEKNMACATADLT